MPPAPGSKPPTSPQSDGEAADDGRVGTLTSVGAVPPAPVVTAVEPDHSGSLGKTIFVATVPPPAGPAAAVEELPAGVPMPIARESDSKRPLEPSTEDRVWQTAVSLLADETPSSPARTRFAAGDVVPGTRYRIMRHIGDGGMGVVYEAEHLDIERRVALKILRSQICKSPDVAQRFRDEARGASRVGSDNIVEIYDFAELDDGRLLFAMELLRGPTLAREMRDGPLAVPRSVAILRQACKGLWAAHSMGIVHRDVKPENIVLETIRQRSDTVKLLDFGICTMLEGGHATEATVAGTPHYLAPEIIAGLPFDHRADIYAFGCTAYEMLTGQPPFGGATVRTILDGHLEKEPSPPSLARKKGVISPELDAFVLRCLAKQPEGRFADVRDCEAALCEAQIAAKIHTLWDDLPLPDVEPKRREALARNMPEPATRAYQAVPQRRRWVWPAIAGLSLLVAAGGVSYSFLFPPPAEVTDADSERDDAERLLEAARAAASRSYFLFPPAEFPKQPTAYSKLIELEQLEGAAERAKMLRTEFAQTLIRMGDDAWETDAGKPFAVEYYTQALMFDPANEHAKSRVDIPDRKLEQLREKADAQSFTKEELLAKEEERRRERELSATRSKRKPKSDKRSGGSNSVKDAVDLASRGHKALKAGKRADAEKLFKHALAKSSRNPPALIGLSDVYFARGKYTQARDYAKKAVAVAPRNGNYRIRLGDAFYAIRAYKDAKKQYLEAKKLKHPDADRRLAKVAAKVGKKKKKQ